MNGKVCGLFPKTVSINCAVDPLWMQVPGDSERSARTVAPARDLPVHPKLTVRLTSASRSCLFCPYFFVVILPFMRITLDSAQRCNNRVESGLYSE